MSIEKRKVYCEKCNQKVEYLIINEIKEEYKNVKINVEQNIGICSQCMERLYVDELEESNLDRLYIKYRELTETVSPKDIIEFRKKYNISQEELVAILDWGKMSVNRYEMGSLPNQNHIEILKLVINYENYFKEKAKDSYNSNKITEKTYSKIFAYTDCENTEEKSS